MKSKNNGNVVNVNKLMHEYSKLRVSPEASKELSGRIIDKLYDMALLILIESLRATIERQSWKKT